ncbi:MAG: D-2-hydroxyacid dehydrogenase [Chloroflexi bacterium]|nr:D-2-hydroxyacid dehydrogenase [Chloroflexota bacterium]
MTAHSVLLRLPLSEADRHSFVDEFPDVEFVDGDADADLDSIDVLFAGEPVGDELIDRMGKLVWLHTTSGGGGRFLTPSVRERSITLTTSTGIHGRPFAEFGIACMYGLAKKLPVILEAQRRTVWDRGLTSMDKVGEKTVGIVGLGTVGSELARTVKALGMRVLATKRTVATTPPYVDELGPPEYLGAMLREADVLFLTLPPTSGVLIGEAELRSMKPGSYVINLTGGRRGIDDDALIAAIRDGHIAGAALNSSTPIDADSELWALPNVILSPGLAADDPDKWQMQRAVFVDNLGRFLRGEELRNVVGATQDY